MANEVSQQIVHPKHRVYLSIEDRDTDFNLKAFVAVQYRISQRKTICFVVVLMLHLCKGQLSGKDSEVENTKELK